MFFFFVGLYLLLIGLFFFVRLLLQTCFIVGEDKGEGEGGGLGGGKLSFTSAHVGESTF